MLLNSFYETSITLISEPDKDITKKTTHTKKKENKQTQDKW